jgi:hypothetical protein
MSAKIGDAQRKDDLEDVEIDAVTGPQDKVCACIVKRRRRRIP